MARTLKGLTRLASNPLQGVEPGLPAPDRFRGCFVAVTLGNYLCRRRAPSVKARPTECVVCGAWLSAFLDAPPLRPFTPPSATTPHAPLSQRPPVIRARYRTVTQPLPPPDSLLRVELDSRSPRRHPEAPPQAQPVLPPCPFGARGAPRRPPLQPRVPRRALRRSPQRH